MPEDGPDDAWGLEYKGYQKINQKMPDDIELQGNVWELGLQGNVREWRRMSEN